MSAWADLMFDTVTIELANGTDAYGNQTYSAPVEYRGRLSGPNTASRILEGTEAVNRRRFIADGEVVANINSRITLSDGSQPPITDVNDYPDETGQKFTVIVL